MRCTIFCIPENENGLNLSSSTSRRIIGVPWQPVLDKRIGQHITGIMRNAGGIEWNFGRKRGLGL